MVFSALLLLVLTVNGHFAAGSDRDDENQSGEPFDASTLITDQYGSSVVSTNPTTPPADDDSKRSFRRLDDSDVDSYVNDDSLDEDLLRYAVYDYDDGSNDKSVHVIDPRSLADPSIIDESDDGF